MWKEENQKLCKTFVFKDFSEAFAFITRVAMLAEQHQHHPTLINTWNTVELQWCTHEAQNTITEKDYQLANATDQLLR